MITSKSKSNLLDSYTPLPINFEYGSGAWLVDPKGNKYLDLISGMGVNLLGHANYKIIKAIQEQSAKLIHVSNLVEIPQQQILSQMLANLSGIDNAKMFFANSGAETIEAAIKLTRLYSNYRNITDPKIIVMDNSYHGRTFAALSATNNPEYKKGFEPLLDCFIKVPFNNVNALQQLSDAQIAPNIVAVLLEPIQGEGGIHIPNKGYLKEIRKICDNKNWLMIVDEIQTGLGRTGKMFCYQHDNIIPDVVAVSKGLGNGIPIGACMINQPFANLFTPKSHGSTFGGNPLACTVAIKVLEEIVNNKLWEKAKNFGDYFLLKLKQELANNPCIVDIRGKGLMLGIELNQTYPNLMLDGLKLGLLFNVTRGKVIRLLPPLIIDKTEIDFAVNKITLLLKSTTC